MSILDRFLAVFAPHECLGCGAEGALLCVPCTSDITPVTERCFRCLRSSSANRTCPDCRKTSLLHRVSAATEYQGPAKDLVWKLKSAGAQAAAVTMSATMRDNLHGITGVIVVPIPTASSRVRQRGYDQAKLLARSLASGGGFAYAPCLARIGQAHQVGASRQQRLHQLQGAFRITKPAWVRGAHILLVDDVVTTGASLEAAARVLVAAGALRVEAVVFARA